LLLVGICSESNTPVSAHTITHIERERERVLGEWRQVKETQDEQ
jgi:hypothetical protein